SPASSAHDRTDFIGRLASLLGNVGPAVPHSDEPVCGRGVVTAIVIPALTGGVGRLSVQFHGNPLIAGPPVAENPRPALPATGPPVQRQAGHGGAPRRAGTDTRAENARRWRHPRWRSESPHASEPSDVISASWRGGTAWSGFAGRPGRAVRQRHRSWSRLPPGRKSSPRSWCAAGGTLHRGSERSLMTCGSQVRRYATGARDCGTVR